MPLVKEVCKRCIHNAYEWNGRDEVRWDEGRVLCPGSRGWNGIEEDVPLDCVMLLEQIILQQERVKSYVTS